MKRGYAYPVGLTIFLLLVACGPLALVPSPLPPTPTAPPLAATTLPPTSTPLPPTPTATPTLVPTLPPAPTKTPAAPASLPADVVALMDRIEDEVEELRGLDEIKPITRTLMTQDQLADYLEEEFHREYTPDEIQADTLTLAAFDFVPEDFDLLDLLLDLYSTQVLGLYDDEKDTFYVLSEEEFDILDQVTFAHEYTHGLQDEHFNLETFVDGDTQPDDVLLAHMALVEGDATLSMSEWLQSQVARLTPQDLELLLNPEQDPAGQAALDAAPPIIRETFEFPYTYGLEFVRRLHEQGGWDAVNAAFADPPQSTEQILHPEKYFDRDPPTVVALPPLTDTLGSGWYLVETDNLGEFQTAIYLENFVDETTAEEAAAGWDGDRYALYANGSNRVLVFATVWDTPADRQEFVAAYGLYAEKKYGQPPTGSSETERRWQTAEQTTVITWDDTHVWIVIGPDGETVDKVLGTLGGEAQWEL